MSDTEPTKEALAAAEEIGATLIVQEEGLEYVSLPDTPEPLAAIIDREAALPELLRVAAAAEDADKRGGLTQELEDALDALRRARERTR